MAIKGGWPKRSMPPKNWRQPFITNPSRFGVVVPLIVKGFDRNEFIQREMLHLKSPFSLPEALPPKDWKRAQRVRLLSTTIYAIESAHIFVVIVLCGPLYLYCDINPSLDNELWVTLNVLKMIEKKIAFKSTKHISKKQDPFPMI